MRERVWMHKASGELYVAQNVYMNGRRYWVINYAYDLWLRAHNLKQYEYLGLL